MNDLSSALRTLAGAADSPTPAEPADLWAQGRSRVRRRRLAFGAGLAAVALLVGLGTQVVPTTSVIAPAGPVHAPAVPKNVYAPGGWMPGTDELGPLGQLAVVAGAGVDSDERFYGISATTGEYRYLDLPGRVNGTPVSLSPEGRRVAYWLTGPTSGEGKPAEFETESDIPVDDRPVGGIAVYNTSTGAVTEHLFPSVHGLRPAREGGGPVWMDEQRLVLSFDLIDSAERESQRVYRWRPGADVALPVALPGAPVADGAAAKVDGFAARPVPPDEILLRVGPTRYQRVDWLLDPTSLEITVPRDSYASVWIRGERIFASDGAGTDFDGYVGRVLRGRTATLEKVAGIEGLTPAGWLSDSRMLTSAFSAADGTGSFYAIDLDTGTHVRLGADDSMSTSFASALLERPMVEGDRPPSWPVNLLARPWVQVVVLAFLGLLVGRILWLRKNGWRRRKDWRLRRD